MKRATRKMKVIIMVSIKKNLFRTNGPFWARKWRLLETLDWLEEFRGNLIFLAVRQFFAVRLGWSKLSQATVNWILKQSGHNFFHDYYWTLKQSGHRILKQSRHGFSGKNYLIDNVWILWNVYVWRSKFMVLEIQSYVSLNVKILEY